MIQMLLVGMDHDRMLIPLSHGEVIDRLLILRLKQKKTGKDLSVEIKDYSDVLCEDLDWHAISDLEKLHEELWDVEDDIRAALDRNDKDAVFHLSGRIVTLNGQRIVLKNRIGGKELKQYGKRGK